MSSSEHTFWMSRSTEGDLLAVFAQHQHSVRARNELGHEGKRGVRCRDGVETTTSHLQLVGDQHHACASLLYQIPTQTIMKQMPGHLHMQEVHATIRITQSRQDGRRRVKRVDEWF